MDTPAIDERALQSKEIEAADLFLQLGRLLVANGADTRQVEQVVSTLASSLGFGSSLLVTYEAILMTVECRSTTYTRIGRQLPPVNVDMNAVEALKAIAEELQSGRLNVG
jgi:uncharacterized membrane protein YjjP (DUF1212 family)